MPLENWSSIKEYLALHHAADPQKAYMAQAALAAVKAGLAELAKLGHNFDMIEADAKAGFVEWPKMFYHANHGSLTVESPADADNLGSGWSDKPIGWKEEEPKAPVEPEFVPKAPVPVDIASFVAEGANDHGDPNAESIPEPTPTSESH